jgi:Terminase RNaseH-like domain
LTDAALSLRIQRLLSRVEYFSRYGSGITLRPYQSEIAAAVVESILQKRGRTFVVILPRQSGKNEVQAQIEAYLLTLLAHCDVEMVSVSPTFKPQTINAMDRLERTLERNVLTRGRWRRHAGYTFQLGRACIHFFSGSPTAHTVGATASALLSIDEAQDIRPATYDRKFAPMAASTNATRIFWGTAWTSTTLLAREKRIAEIHQKTDGVRRLWHLSVGDVQAVLPAYGEFVRGEIKRLGRDHPYIKTQYFSEEIDAQLGMFNPTRLTLMFADQPPQSSPLPPAEGLRASRGAFAFLLDVAGQDESRMDLSADDAPLANPGRDAVSLSIASVDLSTLATLRAPTYRIVNRQQWTGHNHLAVFGKLKALIDSWHPQYIVMDATGVGEGLWALLDKACPTLVYPVKFSLQEKSEIGWRFLAIIETGRFRDCAPSDAVRLQYAACRSEILPGPAKTLRWGVPDGTRGPDGELIHDDYLLADSLVAVLDRLKWIFPMETTIIPPNIDPLKEMSRHF